MGKLKWIVLILLSVAMAQVGNDIKGDLGKITNDVRQLQFARRNLSLTKCNDLLAFADLESANIFKYRNEIFKTLFCNQPDLNDTLFFQMVYYFGNSMWLAEVHSRHWEQKYKKERRKKIRIILGTITAITCGTALNIIITRAVVKHHID